MANQALDEDARCSKRTLFFSLSLSLSPPLSLCLSVPHQHSVSPQVVDFDATEIHQRYRVYIDTNLDGTSDGEIYPGFG